MCEDGDPARCVAAFPGPDQEIARALTRVIHRKSPPVFLADPEAIVLRLALFPPDPASIPTSASLRRRTPCRTRGFSKPALTRFDPGDADAFRDRPRDDKWLEKQWPEKPADTNGSKVAWAENADAVDNLELIRH
jgi:hypothetical protein